MTQILIENLARPASSLPPRHRSLTRWSRLLLPVLLIHIAVVAIVSTTWLILGSDHSLAEKALQISTCISATLACGASYVVWRRHWTLPTRRLAQLIHQALQGELPIEHFAGIDGGMEPLLPPIRALLRDLKQHRAQIAQLDEEMRQRIAGRTDALERKIGSLKVQATRDPLTGLQNRRSLEEQLPRLLEQHRELPSEMCLLMIDIDHFKQLNDSLGHAAGDQLLREIGQIIRSTLRPGDQAFRCGGDEFIVLANECCHDQALKIGARLQSLVDGLARTLQTPVPVGMSYGTSSSAEFVSATPQLMLETADKRLYETKAARHHAQRTTRRAS